MICSRAGKTIAGTGALLAAFGAGGVRAADAQKLLVAVVGQEKRGAKLLATFDSGLKWFGRVAFTPDARRLIVSSEMGADMTWDIARQHRAAFHPAPKPLAEMPLDALPVPLLSPDGAARVTVPNKHRIVILNRSTGQRRVFTVRDGKEQAVAFTPDSRLLLVAVFASSGESEGEGTSTIRVVEVKTGRLARVLNAGDARLDQFVFSHNGGQMATRHSRIWGIPIHNQDAVKVWDTRTWKVRFNYPIKNGILRVQFAKDDRTLLALCSNWVNSDYYLSKYDLGGGQSGELSIHQDNEAMRFANMELSQDGTLLVSTFEGHATAWNVATGRSVSLYDRGETTNGANADNIALSADNQLVADIDANGIVTLWQMPPLSAWRKGAGK